MTAPRRLDLRQELALALLPAAVVLMLCGVETFSRQRLIFASLASGTYAIYIDPEHPMNGMRRLVLVQSSAALIGFGAEYLLDVDYDAAGAAMVVTIVVLIAADALHPAAVSTSLTFAFPASAASSLSLRGATLPR